jgi:hypothetical protein
MSEFTGYDPTIEDRDWIANLGVQMQFTLRDFKAPDQIDPRGKMRHDRQGNMGSCQGFSLSNATEYLWSLAYDGFSNDRQISALYCYLESQRLDELLGSDRGSTIKGGLRVATEIGVLPEQFLPYKTPYPTNARSLITDAMRSEASAYVVRSFTWLESYNDIFTYLASKAGAVHTGTVWNDSFYSSDGVLQSVSLRNGGGHATAWLGYSARKDSSGRNYLWRLNSHNDSWTEIAPSVVDALCRHQ